MYIDQFIHYFNELIEKEAAFIELELKLLIDPRIHTPHFIKKKDLEMAFNQIKMIINKTKEAAEKIEYHQTINFIKSNKTFSLIKELHFENGEQIKDKKRIYKKEPMHSPMFLCDNNINIKLTTNREEIINEEITEFDLIRYKNRASFILDLWRVDITFIKNSISKEINNIKQIKNALFMYNLETELNNKNLWDYADKIEIEIEYLNKIPLTLTNLKTIKDFITSYNTNEETPDSILNKLNLLTKSNKYANTLKKILPSVIEINKKQYFEEILPFIQNFYLTDKADGIRTILLINETSITIFNAEEFSIHPSHITINETIIECEKIDDILYGFDILMYNGEKITDLNFIKRLEYLNKCAGIYQNLKIKTFISLDDTYATTIKEFYNIRRPYEIDGLIFTSKHHMYNKTLYYKWKPPHVMTIDFLVKECPRNLLGVSPYIVKPGHTLYLLFVGITERDFKKLNMKKIQYYATLFTHLEKAYHPIQFSPSDKPNAYLFWHPSGISLDNKIAELTYENKWRLLRIREDRAVDLEKKQYYGNNFKVAEIIWRNFSNPLTLETICSSYNELSKEFYFIVSNSKTHNPIRKFNNMVKYDLLKRILNYNSKSKWIIDLGCGKGQDLFKYIKLGVNNMLLIDNNNNNLCELISRKYNYCNNPEFNKCRTSIYIQNLNLSQNYLSNLNILENAGITFSKIDTKLVICNFAIHYFTNDIKYIKNLVNLVDAFLTSGGRFIFTCLNGEKIFNLLETNGEWGDKNKYYIKKLYTEKKFTGINQIIEILLPFSNGALYTEYLVNLELIEKTFKKKKFSLESQNSFTLFLEQFAINSPGLFKQLDDNDKFYIDMLNFSVFIKN